MNDATRPIIGIENRTAQEVFDIMRDRLRTALATAEAEWDAAHNEALEKAAEVAEMTEFLSKVQGVTMGLAMSGRAHPAPDQALMDLFNGAQDILERARVRANQTKETPNADK